ncbi:hypothetical protein [Lunatibacter salilacus]|uniref:hypothetical protein n=1 Tax=Lunatibacter salilacus TaxID=2483804 RepID=UPI00131BD7C0|nr:hypothetical protein [Lunatibacter salilacus]
MRFIPYLSVMLALIANMLWPFAFTGSFDYSQEEYFQDPALIGPSSACLNGPYVYGNFSGAGDPATDRYIWTITDSNGFELYYQAGEADVQNIQFPFTSTGVFNVNLRVIRGGNQNFFSQTQQVVVEMGPRFVLAPDVIICGNEPVLLQALDTTDPNYSNFQIEWFRVNGQVLGRENTFLATEPGRYYVKVISAVCEAVGSTFLGPSIQVDVTASATRACLGQTVDYTPDAPFLGRWSYQKVGQTERTFMEESFTLALNTQNLEGLGQYKIFFSVDDSERPGCSVEKEFNLNVEEGAGFFTVNKISDSEGCDASNGAFEIISNNAFDSIVIAGVPNGTITNVPANETRTITGLAPRVYTITGRLGNCTVTRNITIGNTDLDEAIAFTVAATPQTCSANGINLGTLVIDFNGLSQSGRYRIVGAGGNVLSEPFQNQTQVVVNVPAGTYQVEVSNDVNCSSTNSISYVVEGSSQINFSIPGDITACQSYELFPESGAPLNYSLRRPDGTEVTGNSGDGFILNQQGSYQLIGRSNDPNSPLCPRTRSFDVTINQPLEYDVIIEQIDCFGNQFITADLNGRDPNTVIIRWLTEERSIVGRDQVFFPPSTGRFILEVQPRASSRCEVEPVSFEVVIPQSQTEVVLEAIPYCDMDPFTTLTMTAANPDIVETIEWFKIDDQGGEEWLLAFENQTSIDVIDEGLYKVVVRNQIGCRLGSAEFEVIKAALVEIELEDTYKICSADNIFPILNPGQLNDIEWYWEGSLVSTAATYKIIAPGAYELRTTNEEGCSQVKNFEVTEDCVLLIRHPDAMIVGDPSRDFRVYANSDVDEVEVFIYQRTGELIFHSVNTATNPNLPVIVWDGQLNGKPVSVGTYPVLIHYKSQSLGLDEVLRKSLIVVE